MKTYRNKRSYVNPSLERVELDKDISLTLDSLSPYDDPNMLVKGVEMASELLASPLKSII